MSRDLEAIAALEHLRAHFEADKPEYSLSVCDASNSMQGHLVIWNLPKAPDPLLGAIAKGGTRISKEILKKELPKEQVVKLFEEGKTEVIDGFISKKGRPFNAHLLLDKSTGKLGWEFPPRAKKKAASKKED